MQLVLSGLKTFILKGHLETCVKYNDFTVTLIETTSVYFNPHSLTYTKTGTSDIHQSVEYICHSSHVTCF